MSGKISGQVWDLNLPHREMFVLLAITDHADHDGNNMHPSVDLLAWKTGYTRRSVIRILNKLVERGVLVKVTRPGYSSLYSANLDAAPRKAARPKSKRTRDTAMTHVKLSPVTTAPVKRTGRGDTPSAKNDAEPSVEPSDHDRPFIPTDQQKAIGVLARFYSARCNQLLGGYAQREMNRLAEDFTLAQIEQAVLAVGDKELERPFQYLRKVLANAQQMAAVAPQQPAGPSGFWGREFTE